MSVAVVAKVANFISDYFINELMLVAFVARVAKYVCGKLVVHIYRVLVAVVAKSR